MVLRFVLSAASMIGELERIAGQCDGVRCDMAMDGRLPFADLGTSQWRLKDLLADATYDWHGNDLQGRGLYLDERPGARGFSP